MILARLYNKRNIFVIRVCDDRLGERLLFEDANTLTFDNALHRVEAFKRARSERQHVGHSTAALNLTSTTRTENQWQPMHNRPDRSSSDTKCFRCRSTQHLANSPICTARKAECRKCGKIEHYQIVCRSQEPSAMQRRPRQVTTLSQKPTTNAINTTPASDDCCLLYSIGFTDELCRDVVIDGHQMHILIDTGAQCNTLPSYIVPNIKTTPTTVKVTALGNHPIGVIGETTCSVTYRHTTLTANFIIVDTAANQVPLFSAQLCQQLGMLCELLLPMYRMHFLSMM